VKVGFIGQGWIGKHYADDFENRGLDVVRYSLEEPHVSNKEKIAACDIVFVAVPTPTTPDGFDVSRVQNVLPLIRPGATAVIKSTIVPGTTEALQLEYPGIFVLHSPEFLAESTAAYDASHPNRNIVGIPQETEEFVRRANEVLAVLPRAPFERVMRARDAELVKYAGNCFLYTKVLFMNLLFDVVESEGASFDTVREALVADPRIGASHTRPVHQGGRGAGGDCFIKDFEVFRRMYAKLGDEKGNAVLEALIQKNLELLLLSGKDSLLLRGVYGPAALDTKKARMLQ
jgi:UDPglucose 6-dehydrogenase